VGKRRRRMISSERAKEINHSFAGKFPDTTIEIEVM
jgi:hypothetical protein